MSFRARADRRPHKRTLAHRHADLTLRLTWGDLDKLTAEGLAQTTGLTVEHCARALENKRGGLL